MLSQLIIGADMLLATSGKYISKVNYDKRIFDWLNLSCGLEIKADNQFSMIEAVFYNNGLFLKSIKPLKIRELEGFIRLKKEIESNLKATIEEISEIAETGRYFTYAICIGICRTGG